MKFENTKVMNFEGAFRGLRNPKNSWDKSDSFFGLTNLKNDGEEVVKKWFETYHPGLKYPENLSEKSVELLDAYTKKLVDNGILNMDASGEIVEVALIGPNDMKLAQTLIKAGPEHRKFLRQIFVSVDITAPLFWWKEADTYKVATVANSTSTMHKLATTPITLENFEIDDFEPNLTYCEVSDSNNHAVTYNAGDLSDTIIEQLELLRQKYLETNDKRYWKELIRWLPEGWLQKRTWTANYETIRAMCSTGQRRFHKLNEWSGQDDPSKNNFIQWARSLPYAQYLIFDDENIPFQIEK